MPTWENQEYKAVLRFPSPLRKDKYANSHLNSPDIRSCSQINHDCIWPL